MQTSSYIFCILSGVLISCSAPVGPEAQSTAIPKADENQTIEVQLWAGGVKYATYVGGLEWRATFEAKVLSAAAENIRDQSRSNFSGNRN